MTSPRLQRAERGSRARERSGARVTRPWVYLLCALLPGPSCDNGSIGSGADSGGGDGWAVLDAARPTCIGGTDKDGDGYGQNCPAGDDCNDADDTMYPGAKEVCDEKDNDCDNQVDEGVQNKCGTCTPGCQLFGDKPFEIDPTQDPGVKDANGVGLDANGDLVLDKTKKNFNYMWIANTFDVPGLGNGCNYANNVSYNPAAAPWCRGTVSKIDTKNLKEVARYFTVTCTTTTGATGCEDLHGKPITRLFSHAPSRTAVDYNFDVWVANRGFAGQASATKIANDPADCVDRNKDQVIDTSADRNGDGKITLDCNADGVPDDASTVCTGAYAAMKPEFLGYDDECILFTVNYSDLNDVGRSICLDTGIDTGASSAWVGTWQHQSGSQPVNRFFKIDGKTGALSGPFDVVAGHHSYGCVVDSKRILWSTDIAGTLTYLNTVNPTQVGPALTPPWPAPAFYGIGIDGNDHIWLGGWSSGKTYRYKPVRTSFATLGSGTWTGLIQPALFDYTRGIAADDRGKVWVAVNAGYLWRVDQSVADGLQDLSTSTDYWPTSGSTVIGAGVDFEGNVWGISYGNDVASRLDVDAQGDVIQPPTAQTKTVTVGRNPYTYSDFTGYGLQNFTRPQGRYLYQLKPCPAGVQAKWKQVSWTATVPTNTSIELRLRSGDDENSLGSWQGPYQSSPVLLDPKSATPLSPNPAMILQLEFTLQSTSKQDSPILHDFNVSFDCTQTPG